MPTPALDWIILTEADAGKVREILMRTWMAGPGPSQRVMIGADHVGGENEP